MKLREWLFVILGILCVLGLLASLLPGGGPA